MKPLLFVLSILSFGCSSLKKKTPRNVEVSIFAPDTLIYCQAHSPWISNCLYFHKSDKHSNRGTFERIMESDDGQRWHATGKFTEAKNRITLHSFKLVRSLESSANDTTIIPTLTFIKSRDSLIQWENIQESKTIFVRQSK